MFEELPDEDEYPDYYKVIPNPMDMKTIHHKTQSLEYTTEDEFIQDFEIMFQNARHYNEETSEIYKDSVGLEKALKKKRRWMNSIAGLYYVTKFIPVRSILGYDIRLQFGMVIVLNNRITKIYNHTEN